MSLFLIACGKDDSSDDPGDDSQKGDAYELFAREIERTLVGENVKGSWDPDLNFIYLGPDDVIEPLGSLTLEIGTISGNQAQVLEAFFSTSDKKVGTGPEINGRAFDLEPGGCSTIFIEKVNDNYISVDSMCINMIQVISDPTKTPVPITLTGWFRVLN